MEAGGGESPTFTLNSGIPLVSARKRISVMPLANTKVSIQIVNVARNVTNSLAKKLSKPQILLHTKIHREAI